MDVKFFIRENATVSARMGTFGIKLGFTTVPEENDFANKYYIYHHNQL